IYSRDWSSDVCSSDLFRFQLTNRQFFDLFQDFDRRLDDLSRTVQAALAGTPVQDARSGTTSTPGEGTAWRLPVAILAMLLVVARSEERRAGEEYRCRR